MASFTGIGSAFGGFFGAQDLEDAYDKAVHEWNQLKEMTQPSVEGFRARGAATYDRFATALTNPEMAPDIAKAREFLMTNIQNGLSPAAQLYMQDANRYLEGRAISTGNLRSGAIGLQRAQLGQRVVSDEFTRALNAVQSFRQGDVNAAGVLGQVSLGYGQLENVALNNLGQAISGLTQSQVGVGTSEYAQKVALGQGIGGLFDKVEQYMTFGAGTMTNGEGGGAGQSFGMPKWTG